MNQYGPGEMTSTHSANPVCAAAALANLTHLREQNVIDHVATLAPILADGARRIQRASVGAIGRVDATGLVAALQFTRDGTCEPDAETAWRFVWSAVQRGILLFAPVGVGGCCVKINPPLLIEEAALREGLDVLVAVAQSLAQGVPTTA